MKAWYGRNESRGLSPASDSDVADELRVEKSTVSRWREKGRLPPADYLLDVSDRMGMPFRDVLDPTVPFGFQRDAAQRLTERFTRYHPVAAEAMLKAIEENANLVPALTRLGGAQLPPG